MSQLHRPPNYDSTILQRTPPEPGGYVMDVVGVTKHLADNGGVYLRFQLDINEGLFAGYYQAKYVEERAQSALKQAKWKCVWNVFLDSPRWEETCWAFDDSNYRLKLNLLTDDPAQMKGLKVGAVLSKEVITAKDSGNKYLRLTPVQLLPIGKIQNGEFLIGTYFRSEQNRRRNKSANKDRWEDK